MLQISERKFQARTQKSDYFDFLPNRLPSKNKSVGKYVSTVTEQHPYFPLLKKRQSEDKMKRLTTTWWILKLQYSKNQGAIISDVIWRKGMKR